MKKQPFPHFFLFLLSVMLCQASYYYWDTAIISGKDIASDDPETIIIPEFSHPYGVAVAGNGRVWTASYFHNDRYDMAILVYDPEYGRIDTIGPEIVTTEGDLTLGNCRFFATLGNGNIAYGDWSNDKILVFDQETYEVLALSNSSYLCNVGGGIETFVYSGAQYYLTQQIVGNSIVIWDSTITPIDTLYGSPGGRNLAATEDGSFIISPSLGSNFFTAFRGNPVDGYELDTLYLADLGIDMGNIMYVSSGPNDYFWLFSRDAANDGIYIIDPYDDYDIKQFTNTNNSVTSIGGFSLGMAVEKQYLYWLEQGLIDSSEVYTQGVYTQPWVVRAPCQIAWDYKEECASLYMADFYGYTLKSWMMWPSRPFEMSASNIKVDPGDTATMNIHAMFPHDYSCNSLSMSFIGFLQYTELTDICADGLLANNQWDISYYQSNDTLYVEATGSQAINEIGTLFHIDLLIPDTTRDQIPVDFAKILFDGTEHRMIIKEGSITVIPPAPVLNLSFESIEYDFGNVIINNDPDTAYYDFTIHNTGNDTLKGTITTSLEWIALSQDTFVVNEDDSLIITVTATTSSLPLGSYSGRVRVYSNGGDASGMVWVTIQELSKIDAIPSEYRLYPNYPNPFNPSTHIDFGLPEQTDVDLIIYDIMGHTVRSWHIQQASPGWHKVIWDGKNASGCSLPSGVYIYSLMAGNFKDKNKMLLIK